MTRVLMIAPTPFFSDRGCHVRIYEQARSLKGRGLELALLTYPIGLDPPGLAPVRVKKLEGYERTEPGPAWPRLLLDARVLREAWRLCGSFKPDLIHAHLHEGALIARALKVRFRLPVIFDYQGSLFAESVQHGFLKPRGAMARLFKAVETFIERGADKIVVSAEAMSRELSDKGLAPEPLPDGVDPERFSPGPKNRDLARDLGLPDDAPVAVFLGVISDYQGADIMIESARLLRERKIRVHFLVMGYPEAEAGKEAERRGLADAMSFTGRLDYFRAHEYLRLGTLALAPKLSATESNGKVLNYMAAGLPVAAFDLPVNRELLGEHAEWAEPDQDRARAARSFAEAVARLLADPERAASLGRQGRERAAERFSVAAQADKLISLYRSLLDDSR